MSDVIWEDPPNADSKRPSGFGRTKSPLGVECDALVDTLMDNEGKWARLFDFRTKEDARKRASFMGRKGLSLYCRETEHGFSLFGRWNGLPDEPEPQPEPAPEPSPGTPGDLEATDPASADAIRPATF